jgi:hypothetical protein
MKHRSVIAFIIIAAALFAAPQISHDLSALKSDVGARLRGELLHAFLSLPSGEGARVPAARRVDTMLASCTREKTGEPATKARKSEPRASVASQSEARAEESGREQIASNVNPSSAPDVWTAELSRRDLKAVAGKADELSRRVQTDGELAMLIPPGTGIDPRAFVAARAFEASTRDAALQKRKLTGEVRRVSFIATGFDGKNVEWRKTGDEALRRFNESLPGAYELRFARDWGKRKVLKTRRTGGAGPAGARAPQVPWQVASLAPALVVDAQAPPAGE